MKRRDDKYGRGSAALNGVGFVDLEPSDKFSGLDVYKANKDADSERMPRGGTASLQNRVPQLASGVAYCVDDVKCPAL